MPLLRDVVVHLIMEFDNEFVDDRKIAIVDDLLEDLILRPFDIHFDDDVVLRAETLAKPCAEIEALHLERSVVVDGTQVLRVASHECGPAPEVLAPLRGELEFQDLVPNPNGLVAVLDSCLGVFTNRALTLAL